MSNWLDRIVTTAVRSKAVDKASVPDGLWSKCGACGAVLYQPELSEISAFAKVWSSWPTRSTYSFRWIFGRGFEHRAVKELVAETAEI